MADLKNGILDIFCGAGGLSLGFLLEGFDIVYSSDNNSRAIDTIETNHSKIHSQKGEDDYHYTSVEDINKLTATKIKKIFEERGYRVQGIIGGPPCQGFSVANRQTRNIDNPNNSLFEHYLRLIKTLNPDFIVFENVVGFASMANGDYKKTVLDTLEKLKFVKGWKIIDAEWYGVPQTRRRVIIIGIKRSKIKTDYKKKIAFPEKNNCSVPTVKNAFSGLPSIKMGETRDIQSYHPGRMSNYAKSLQSSPELNIESKNVYNHITTLSNDLVLKRYKYLKPGQNWANLPDELINNYEDKYRCHSYIYKRLEEDKPSITVSNFRKCMFIHPTEDRGLSVREAARLQSFPDWYEFKGELSYQQQQVACAVPPLMARSIAQQIKKMLK
ncbi:MAG: DNA cytosine methyltransferase [Methanoregula sp.]|nr:DNA cytosine methyltransferase [Methanoregula sp.]